MDNWDSVTPLNIYISLLSERENTVLQWKFKLNCAMAAAENRDLKDHTPKAKW